MSITVNIYCDKLRVSLQFHQVYHTHTKCYNSSVLPFRSDFLEERTFDTIVRWSFDATLVNISWWITGKEFVQISIVRSVITSLDVTCFRDRLHMTVTFDMNWCSIRMKWRYFGLVTHSCSLRGCWIVSITRRSHKQDFFTVELGTCGDRGPSYWWSVVTDCVMWSWLAWLDVVSVTDMRCFLRFSVIIWFTCEAKWKRKNLV